MEDLSWNNMSYKGQIEVPIKDPKKRRKCPLCGQNMFLYYIEYVEKLLMCENEHCEYPFGYEAIQIVRDESQLRENPAKATAEFFEYPLFKDDGSEAAPLPVPSTSGTSLRTMSSLSCLSDCDQLSLISESDVVSVNKEETLTERLTKQDKRRKKQHAIDTDIEKNLKQIRSLNEELNILKDEDDCNSRVIKNKKWLRNLKEWENQSGAKLLKDDEKRVLVRTNMEFSVGELNISIDPTVTTTAAVKINIALNAPENKELKEDGQLKEDSQLKEDGQLNKDHQLKEDSQSKQDSQSKEDGQLKEDGDLIENDLLEGDGQ